MELAPLLGYRQDTVDRSRWRRKGSVVNVKGAKFFDHLQGSGGGGAIDLVVHARGCTPTAANVCGRCSPVLTSILGADQKFHSGCRKHGSF